MSSVILRKTALARIDPIPTHVRLAADYYLYLALSLHFEARAFPEPVCLYREHDTNLSCRSGRELQFECVRLINQFCPWISPSLARSRRRIHHSLIAFADMSHLATFRRGFKHLLAEGSLSYLASRPVVRCYRRAKRSIVRPYWKQFDPHPEARVKSQELFKKPQLTQASPRQFTLLDTNICTTTFAGAQNFLASMVEQRVPGYICNANTYSVIYARDDYRYRRAIAGASYVNADGMPLVWLLRALGQPMERVHGDDLFLSCCEQFPEWRHFLVGGRDGQGELVAAELKRRYPTLNLVGFRSTPSRPPSAAESASIVQQIREVNASIVWVGMGTPSQDFWMSWAAMSVGVPMAGVGSSFDVLAGYTQAAPEWMKRCGLQWLFRLVQEPRRLARRYLYYNSRFLLAAAREWPRLFRRSVRTAPTEGLRAE